MVKSIQIGHEPAVTCGWIVKKKQDSDELISLSISLVQTLGNNVFKVAVHTLCNNAFPAALCQCMEV